MELFRDSVPQAPSLWIREFMTLTESLVPWQCPFSLLSWAGPAVLSPSPGTSPATSALVGNASQKAHSILGLVSPVHFSNDQLSRHVSILRTVLADNDSDGKAIGLALRDADSLGKKKCSQGTDVQINTTPHFTIKQPTFDEMFPQRSLCWLIASLHQLLSEPAPGRQCSCLRERHYRHQPFGTCVPPGAAGDQHGAWLRSTWGWRSVVSLWVGTQRTSDANFW